MYWGGIEAIDREQGLSGSSPFLEIRHKPTGTTRSTRTWEHGRVPSNVATMLGADPGQLLSLGPRWRTAAEERLLSLRLRSRTTGSRESGVVYETDPVTAPSSLASIPVCLKFNSFIDHNSRAIQTVDSSQPLGAGARPPVVVEDASSTVLEQMRRSLSHASRELIPVETCIPYSLLGPIIGCIDPGRQTAKSLRSRMFQVRPVGEC